MKRFYFLLLFSVAAAGTAFSQTSNCTQTLRVARTTYEQGRLHELPGLVEACLTSGFTKEERRETYRLLTLAYIYLEEPEKADEMMLKLLQTDHFFEINKALDPAEFISLYNKYRTKPLFRVGAKFLVNFTQPRALNYYNVASEGGGNGNYGMTTSFQVFAMFEKDFGDKLVLAPEIGYVTRSFEYSNNELNLPDFASFPVSGLQYTVTQSWIDLNVLGQYKLKSNLNRQLYVGLGPGASYLLSSINEPQTTLEGQQQYAVTGASVNDTKCYNKLVYSVSVTAGGKLKVGELYLTADLRYQVGLNNVVNPSSRTNTELTYDYQIQYNDYTMNNFMVNIGVLYPYFKPKKLIK